MDIREYSRTRRIDEPERNEHTQQRLPSPVPESAMYRRLAAKLADDGYTCWRDVSFLGAWIDLFARRDDGASLAVELKVADWRRALRQATRIRGAADRTYVALWAPYVHRALVPDAIERFETLGLGLLSINGACETKIPAVSRHAKYAAHVLLPARATHRAR